MHENNSFPAVSKPRKTMNRLRPTTPWVDGYILENMNECISCLHVCIPRIHPSPIIFPLIIFPPRLVGMGFSFQHFLHLDIRHLRSIQTIPCIVYEFLSMFLACLLHEVEGKVHSNRIPETQREGSHHGKYLISLDGLGGFVQTKANPPERQLLEFSDFPGLFHEQKPRE
mmetsp:Transcript_11184/g.17981  ORF Transcript_11184/g.17981 Transcript_11184/m.17981 type:complete len:170 (+) Transcript_11184:61-570(+)